MKNKVSDDHLARLVTLSDDACSNCPEEMQQFEAYAATHHDRMTIFLVARELLETRFSLTVIRTAVEDLP